MFEDLTEREASVGEVLDLNILFLCARGEKLLVCCKELSLLTPLFL